MLYLKKHAYSDLAFAVPSPGSEYANILIKLTERILQSILNLSANLPNVVFTLFLIAVSINGQYLYLTVHKWTSGAFANKCLLLTQKML